jgi:hypothetical protein
MINEAEHPDACVGTACGFRLVLIAGEKDLSPAPALYHRPVITTMFSGVWKNNLLIRDFLKSV